MRSSAKYRHSETSYISRNDNFAAMQIDLSVQRWIEAFATLAAYVTPISFRTIFCPAMIKMYLLPQDEQYYTLSRTLMQIGENAITVRTKLRHTKLAVLRYLGDAAA